MCIAQAIALLALVSVAIAAPQVAPELTRSEVRDEHGQFAYSLSSNGKVNWSSFSYENRQGFASYNCYFS